MIQAVAQFSQPPGGFQPVEPVQLLIQLAMLLLPVGIFAFSVVVICLNFGAIKRSWREGIDVGVESAIAGHVMLNLVAVVMSLFLG